MTVFSHILSKEECTYNEELDRYVSNLDILIGGNGESPRELSDIIYVTDTYNRVHSRHIRNVLPIGTFSGNKKEYSFIALVRYLKNTFSPTNKKVIRDVRERL